MLARSASQFLAKIDCRITRRILAQTIETYRSLFHLIPKRQRGYVVEFGPGNLSMVAMAANSLSQGTALHYIGLERDEGNANELKRFLSRYRLGGEVREESIFDPRLEGLLPRNVSVFCFEHSLEDIFLGVVAETLGLDTSKFSAAIELLSEQLFNLNLQDLVPLCLEGTLEVVKKLSIERPGAACIVHHFCSPRYTGPHSNLYLLDQIVTRLAKTTLRTKYRAIHWYQPHSALTQEFWWLGYLD